MIIHIVEATDRDITLLFFGKRAFYWGEKYPFQEMSNDDKQDWLDILSGKSTFWSNAWWTKIL